MLGDSLVTRICLTRPPYETGRVHGQDIELAQVVRRLNIKVALVALPVLHGLVVVAHKRMVDARHYQGRSSSLSRKNSSSSITIMTLIVRAENQ